MNEVWSKLFLFGPKWWIRKVDSKWWEKLKKEDFCKPQWLKECGSREKRYKNKLILSNVLWWVPYHIQNGEVPKDIRYYILSSMTKKKSVILKHFPLKASSFKPPASSASLSSTCTLKFNNWELGHY